MTSLDDNLRTSAPSRNQSAPRTDVAPRLRRALFIATAAVAVLIHVPGLRTPLLLDDYTQRAMAEGRYPSPPGPFQLYDFIDDANRATLLDRGILPWWSHPKMVMRFLRPLSSALLWVDYRVAGGHPLWGHIHSFLWWAAACFAVHALLRRLFSARVAWLGVAIFALAPCHALPLAWMANREELVSTALGTAAFAVYLRWREERRGRDGWLSLALFSVAALAGEYTLCFTGYIVAAEVVLRRESIPRRLVGLASFAIPVAAYMVAHKLLRYGAFGIGYYHDPIGDLGSYASSAPRRLGVLVGTAWLGINDVAWLNEPGWKLAVLTMGAAALLVVPIARMLRDLDPLRRGRALTMLIGSLLSMAPVMAVDPSVRLLEVPMVGVSAVVALLVDHAWFPSQPRPRRGAAELTELVVLGLAFIHFFRAPLDTWLAQASTRTWASAFATRLSTLSDRTEGKSTVMVLRANISQAIFFAPLVVDPGDGVDGADVRVRTLTLRSGRCLLRRTSARAFELVGGAGGLFPTGPDDLLRDVPLHQGERVDLDGMRVTLLEVRDDGSARRARFEFDRDLDDPSMLWLVDGTSGFHEQKLPAIGFGELLDP
jgi:hypothetical protein